MILRPLAARYLAGMTWKAIGAEIGVSGAVVYRAIVKGYEPHGNAIRARLGLPVLAPAPVCRSCGQVHVTKRCTAARQPVKPRSGQTPRQKRLLSILGGLWTKGTPDPIR